MDLETLLERNRRSLIQPDRSLTPSEKRAHDQFAREYAGQTRRAREPETGEQRIMRAAEKREERKERSAAEDKTLDAAVRESIRLHGA
jgi:hypothetical protein